MTESNKNITHLKFGDLIILYGYSKKQKKTTTGLLCATGYTDDRVFFQTSPENLSNPNNKEALAEILSIQNYRDSVFQVWPKVSYDAYKSYNKSRKEYEQLQKAISLKKQEENQNLDEIKTNISKITKQETGQENLQIDEQKDLLESLEVRMNEMKKRIIEENKANEVQLKLVQGDIVQYGVEVQLMHYDSKSFLNGKIVSSDSDKSSYKFVLNNEYGSGMIFKFMPRFKLRQQGERIEYGDSILLINKRLNCYVNFSCDIPVDLDRVLRDQQQQQVQLVKNPIAGKNQQYVNRYESFISVESDAKWQIYAYNNCGGQDDEEEYAELNIQGGDLIRLRHTETNGYLTADINYQQDNILEEAYIRVYDGIEIEEQCSGSSVWEIEIERIDRRGEVCTVFESGDSKAEGVTYQRYRLRHLLTGRLLTLIEQQINGKTQYIPVLQEPGKKVQINDVLSTIKFQPTNIAHPIQIESFASYQIVWNKQYLSIDNNTFYKYQQVPSDSSVFTSLDNDELKVKRRGLKLEMESSSENAFTIVKVEQLERQDLLLIRSALPLLRKFLEILRTQNKVNLTGELLKSVIRVLSRLIFFVLKGVDDKRNAIEVEGITIPQRQALLKQMGIIEILMDILYGPFTQSMYKLEELTQQSDGDLIRVLQLTYRLIKHTIREFRPNELYASQWLDLLMIQTTTKNDNFDLLAEPTLTELIDNNKLLLTQKIKKTTITGFIELLKLSQDEKYINLLRALCTYDGEPAQKNQLVISQELLLDEDTRNKVIYNISEDNGLSTSQNIDSGETYNYFTNLIYLMADLCLERNYVAIHSLENIFTYNICYKIVSSNKFPFDLRSAFAKLIQTLFIDREPFSKLIFPNKIRFWNQIHHVDIDSIHSTEYKTDVKKFDELLQFLNTYVTFIAQQRYFSALEIDKNKLTFNLIKLIKQILEFGFYTTTQSLQELLIPILNILNGTRDVVNVEEKNMVKNSKATQLDSRGRKKSFINPQKKYVAERLKGRYEESEENLVVMQIKDLVSQILLVVQEIKLDLRVSLILRDYKREYESMQEGGNNLGVLGLEQSINPQQKQQYGNAVYNKLSSDDTLNYVQLKNNKFEKLSLEWIEKVLKDETFQMKVSQKNDMDLILLDLTLYKHIPLVCNAFELLYKRHSEQYQLVQYVTQVQIIESDTVLQKVHQLQDICKQLTQLAETAEIWYAKDTVQCVDNTQKFISLLEIFCDTLTITHHNNNNNNIKDTKRIDSPDNEDELKSVSQENFEDLLKDLENGDQLIQENVVFKEGEKPNKTYQILIANIYAFKAPLTLLEFDLSMQQGIYTDLNIKLINKCYQFLSKLIYSNSVNQQILLKYQELFLRHLRDSDKFITNILIEELYKNNQAALTNYEKFDELQALGKIFVSLIDKLPEDNPKRVSLLESLRVFMKCQNKAIKDNQTMVLNLLASKEFSNVMKYGNTPQEQSIFQGIVENYNNALLLSNNNIVKLPPQVNYFCYTLFILALTCEDLNAVTESKCQSYFPLQDLYQMFQTAKNCYTLRKGILFYLYHVFLDAERQFLEDQRTMISFLDQIVEDMIDISEGGSRTTQEIQIINHKASYSLQSIKADYFVHGILPCIDGLLQRSEIQDYSQKNSFKLIRQLLQSITRFNEQQQEISKKIQNDLIKTISLIKYKYQQVYEELKNTLPLELVPQSNNNGGQQQEILQQYNNNNSNEEITKGELIQNCMQSVQGQEDFMEQVEKEFGKLVQSIREIEQKTEKNMKGRCTITYDELMQSLIQLVDVEDMTLSEELTLVGLKIFRKFIEMQNKQVQTPAAEWETDDWSKYELEILKQQNKLCDYNVATLCCNTIGGDPTKVSRELKYEAILISISLLIGGNKRNQQSFLEYMTQQDVNNKFLINLRDLLILNFDKVKKKMSKLNKQRLDNLIYKDSLNNKKMQVTQENILEDEEDIDNSREYIEYSNCIEQVRRIYRLLQLLCEGHNLLLQNHLRVQTFKNQRNSKSINFIQYTAYIFSKFLKCVNIECIVIGDQILDFLIEALQGPCTENQIDLTKTKMIETCKDFISQFDGNSSIQVEYKKRGFINDEEKVKINSLTTKCSTILITIIEANIDNTVINTLSTQLEFDFLKKKLTLVYENFVKNTLELDIMECDPDDINDELPYNFPEEILESFNIYILLVTLSKLNEEAAAQFKDNSGLGENGIRAMEFYQIHTGSIEINFNGELHRVFFPIEPICRLLSNSTRRKLMQDVNRDSVNEKIQSLVDACPELFDEMQHNSELMQMTISVTPKKLNFLRDCSTVFAFLINIIILSTYSWATATKTSIINDVFLNYGIFIEVNSDSLINILGIIQLVFSVVMLLFWFIIKAPLVIKNQWRDLVKQNKNDAEDDIDEEILKQYDSVREMPPQLVRKLLLLRGPDNIWFQKDFGHFAIYIEYYWRNLVFIVQQTSFQYMLFYLVVSVLGFIFTEIFYSLHMIDITNRFATLKNVIKSVTYNANQLILTVVLTVIIIYVISIFGFHFASKTYYNFEYLCTDMVQCFISTLNYGLRNGGGIGDFITPQSFQDQNQSVYSFRYIYDMIFFAIINLIMFNIIFGIIIETFAELRDKKNTIDEDMRNICFICGQDRYTFDRHADGFENHIERDHHLWNYVYFLYIIKTKEPTEFNGIESYIAKKMVSDDNSWFPMLKAMSIKEEGEEDTEAIVEKNIDLIKSGLKLIANKLEKYLKKKQKIQQKKAQAKSQLPEGTQKNPKKSKTSKIKKA